jgi:hypothetical protein
VRIIVKMPTRGADVTALVLSSHPTSTDMATKSEGPVTIKKYANPALYNTGTSTYVTLEDLATMVKTARTFAVVRRQEPARTSRARC